MEMMERRGSPAFRSLTGGPRAWWTHMSVSQWQDGLRQGILVRGEMRWFCNGEEGEARRWFWKGDDGEERGWFCNGEEGEERAAAI